MKKMCAFILSVILTLNYNFSVFADSYEEQLKKYLENAGFYLDSYDGYQHHMNGNMWNNYLKRDDCFGYILFDKNFQNGEYPLLETAMATAANLTGGFSIMNDVYLKTGGEFDPETAIVEYYEIALVSLLAVMEHDFIESVENQEEADRTMSGSDYFLEGSAAAAGFLSTWTGGGEGAEKLFSKAIGYCGIGLDQTEKLYETEKTTKYRYYEAQKYVRFQKILEIVERRSDNQMMRRAAENVDKAVDSCFAYKVDYQEVTGDAVEALKTPFFDVMDMVMKDEGLIALDDDGTLAAAGLLFKGVQLVESVDTGTKTGVFLSDLLVGGSNIVLRYYEMRGMADIRGALIKEIESNDRKIKSADDFEIIQENCELLKDLICVNVRGDYCLYSLLTKDANAYSAVGNATRNLLKMITQDGNIMTFDEWYDQVIRVATGYDQVVQSIIPDVSVYIDSDFQYEPEEEPEKTEETEDRFDANAYSDIYGEYISAVQKTIGNGEWTETLELEADMSLSGNGARVKTKASMVSEAYISGYTEGDLSELAISGNTSLKIMGQSYNWTTEYKQGQAHYQYIEPERKSVDADIPPDFFELGSVTPEMILQEDRSGNQIYFTLSGEKVTEKGIAAVKQIVNAEDLKYGDVELAVTIDEVGKVEKIQMECEASMRYQGYDADVTYDILYSFQ